MTPLSLSKELLKQADLSTTELENFRNRLQAGTSALPPYVLWPELEEGLRDVVNNEPDTDFLKTYNYDFKLSPQDLCEAVGDLLKELNDPPIN